MGSIIYSFLNDSLLFDPGLIDSKYADIADKALTIELRRYREFCLQHWSELSEEVAAEDGMLHLFAGSRANTRLLKQGALYFDAVILADPLFEQTEPEQDGASAWASVTGVPHRQGLDRPAIASAAKQLLDHRPMVAQGYIRYFPTSHYNEAPQELPLFASENGFADVLPPHILAQYQSAATVRSLTPSPEGMLVMNKLSIGRRIHIDFDGSASGRAYGYNLLEQEVLSSNKEDLTVRLAMRMPKEPPSLETFNAWVAQSINLSARKHFQELDRSIRWSARFGAFHATESMFAASILSTAGGTSQETIQTATAQGMLDLNLPYFNDMSIANLMAARSDVEAFTRFRRLLEKQFRELRLESDAEKRRMKTENAMHELLEIQSTEVASAVRRLKRKAILSSLGTGLSVIAAFPTPGAGLLGAICAAYMGYRTYEEYQLTKKESPAYFLWKAGGSQQPR
jgi:hypothetical protein